MGNLIWSGGRYWENTEEADLYGATLALANSFNDKVVAKFSTIAARDAAMSGIPDGALNFVTSTGLMYVKIGSSNYVLPIQGLTYFHGTTAVATDVNGLFNLNHPFGTNPVTAFAQNFYFGAAGAAEPVLADTKISIHSYNNGHATFFCSKISDRTAKGGTTLAVSFRIERIL